MTEVDALSRSKKPSPALKPGRVVSVSLNCACLNARLNPERV